jgi:hypothetical protein
MVRGQDDKYRVKNKKLGCLVCKNERYVLLPFTEQITDMEESKLRRVPHAG